MSELCLGVLFSILGYLWVALVSAVVKKGGHGFSGKLLKSKKGGWFFVFCHKFI